MSEEEEVFAIETEDQDLDLHENDGEVAKHSDYVFRGRCVRVVDGDTYDILCDLGFGVYHKVRVRLRGVDTPEVYGPRACEEGKIASKAVNDLMFDRECLIRTFKNKASSYNRWEAEVYFHDDEGLPCNLARWIVNNEYGKLVEGYTI